MPPLDTILIIAGAALGLVALVCAALAWRGEGSLIAIADTPTRTAAELAELHRHAGGRLGQRVEVAGTVECDGAMQAPYTGTRCVAYDCHMTEERETHVPSVGRYGRGREVETHGYDLHDSRVPRFYVRDASGVIAVDTRGAAIDLKETLARYEEYTGMGGSEREIWREERALPVGHQVHVLGYLGDHGGAPVVGPDPRGRGRFLISHRDERGLARSLRRRAYALYLAGGLSAGAAACLLFVAMR